MKRLDEDDRIQFRARELLSFIQEKARQYRTTPNLAVRRMIEERKEMERLTGDGAKPLAVPDGLARQNHAIDELREEVESLDAAVRSLLARARIPVKGEDEDDET